MGSLVDVDRGIPGTLKALLLRPAHVLQSYLQADRYYVNPFRLLLLTTGIYYLLHTFLIDEAVYVKNMLAAAPKAEFDTALSSKVMDQTQDIMTKLQSEYGTFSMAAMALFIAFVFWLMFRRKAGSFAAALAGTSYVFGLFMALSLLLILPAEALLYRNAEVLPTFLNLYNILFSAFIIVWLVRTYGIVGIRPRILVAVCVLISYMMYSALLFFTLGIFVGLKYAG